MSNNEVKSMPGVEEGGRKRRRGVHMPPGWQEEKAKIAELLDTRQKAKPVPNDKRVAPVTAGSRGKPAIFHEQQQFASECVAAAADEDNKVDSDATTSKSTPDVYQSEFEKFLMITGQTANKPIATSTSNQASSTSTEMDPLNAYISGLVQDSQGMHADEEKVADEVEPPAAAEEGSRTWQLLSDQLHPKILSSLDSLHHEPPFEIIEQTVHQHLDSPILQAVSTATWAHSKVPHSSLALTRFKKAVGTLVGEETMEKAQNVGSHLLPGVDRDCSVEDALKSCGMAAEAEHMKKVYPSLEPLEQKGKYTIRMTLFGHTSAITTVKFSPKGHYILSGGNDGMLKIWAVMRGVRRKALVPFKKSGGSKLGISDAAFSPDQMQVLVVSDDNDPKIIHWPKGRVDKILNAGHDQSPICCTFTNDSRHAVTGGYDGRLILWNCATSVKHVFQHNFPILAVHFNPVNPAIFATGSADGVLRLWDVNRRAEPIAQWMSEGSVVGIPSVKFLPRGNLILTSSEDGHVRLGCVSHRGQSHTLRDYTGHTNCRYYIHSHYDVTGGATPRVLSGSEDGGVYVWDMSSARLMDTLRGHLDTVASIDVHPTSAMICSGGYGKDMCVKVWQMMT